MSQIEQLIFNIIKDGNEDLFSAFLIKRGFESGLINEENKGEVFDDFENLRMISMNMYGMERGDKESKSYVMMNSCLMDLIKFSSLSLKLSDMPRILSEGKEFMNTSDFFAYEELGKTQTPEKLDVNFFNKVFSKGL